MIKRGQRDIPVSELEVWEYEQDPSDERQKKGGQAWPQTGKLGMGKSRKTLTGD